MIETLQSWFAANTEPALTIVIVIGLALLAWKTRFGVVLISVLSAISRMRVVIIAVIVLILAIIIAVEVG